MTPKSAIDVFGATALTGFAIFLAFNQVVIAVMNEGLQPAFSAGLRSVGACLCIWLWLRWRGRRLDLGDGEVARWGLFAGFLFAFEFLCLFIALDLTTVSRSAVIFYTMPVWMALMAHVFTSGDRIGPIKAVGLALAVGGVALAFVGRGGAGGSLLGDLAALGAALGWAATGLMAKASPLRRIAPEGQLFWQVAVSGPLLLLAAPLFGPLIRDLDPIHLWALGYQVVLVVTAGFIFWLWLLSIYPASGVASFSFLSPVFGVFFGWWLMDDPVGPNLFGALALVALGLVLINRPQGGFRFRRRSA